ncbi:MAG: S53 family peptidase [Candidatus Sphingomonas colombiensis]|nr:S53 family peptidase [Sphingomonas sp.]WEK42353.1 MAG: S53 family peptidase [Sphingomonas sp.]
MADNRQILVGSEHAAPRDMKAIGRVPGDEIITVSLYLKPTAQKGAPAVSSRAELRARREKDHAADFDAIAAFAHEAGLEVVAKDAARRLVQLRGKASVVEAAFGTELHHYAQKGKVYRGRTGPLLLPATVVGRVAAVLGLDTSPIATPKIVPHRGTTPPTGFLPTDVAKLYGFGGSDAAGQCIGIIELGGGFTDADNQAAFKAMNMPVPDIVAIGVDGAGNAPGASDADGEVALDIQVAGGVAPGARLAVYFAPNTSQGFVDAITQAVHDDANKPSVLSISWGSGENGWSQQSIAVMGAAFQDAATLNVTVCAASGDGLATDGENDGQAHVDYPASDPAVLGCGGTRITLAGGGITKEVVWNSNGGGTGGGVSVLFALPGYQKNAGVPLPRGSAGGRGVPDVAGNADPDSGYRILTAGQVGIIGGTSAVAPLWAAIVAILNVIRKSPLGLPHAHLYAVPDVFRDITSGDNKSGGVGFSAGKGWDACTGLGSPIGSALRSAPGITAT